jgi:cell division protein FtsQ
VKRPEGFDPPAAGNSAARSPQRAKPPQDATQPKRPSPSKQPKQAPSKPTAVAPSTAKTRRTGIPDRAPRPDAAARAGLRRAARERRRFERAEVRRFTRRARNRRIAILAVGGVILTLALLVSAAVFSPILALRTITVEGASRIDPAEIVAAADDQLGTPLALIDYERMTRDLSVFPLIRSYVTEVVPPGTIVIHVTERQPVGSIASSAGFDLVDPAGIVVQQSAQRLPGIPIIDIAGASVTSSSFAAVVEVLLALPPGLLAQVDSISASTKDDVSFVLTGVGQRVQWGSADLSEKKAALLAGLISVTDPAAPGTFDVSAPGNGVFRPG